MRKAIMGANLLQGMTAKAAALQAGFAVATARTPMAAGLDAESCLAETEKIDPGLNMGELARLGAAVYRRKAEQLLADGKAGEDAVAKCRPSEVARFLEVPARFALGDRTPGDGMAGELDDGRDEYLYMLVMARRGAKVRQVSQSDPPPIDVKSEESQ